LKQHEAPEFIEEFQGFCGFRGLKKDGFDPYGNNMGITLEF
jgi:ribosomal protein L5